MSNEDLRKIIKSFKEQKESNSEEKSKDPIWALPEKSKFKFYNALSICGIVVFLVTMFSKWCGWFWNDLLDIFNDVGKGIFSSVVIIWFAFQVIDWAQPRLETVKAKITELKLIKKIMGWGDPYREKLREAGKEEARQEARDRQSRFEESLRNQNVSPDVIRNAREFSDSKPKDR